jgi:hypothetical protein
MLAVELGRRGVGALLVDEKPSTAFNPQANATQARTMEHFRRLGFADEVRSLGLPAEFPTDIAYFTRFARHELARFALPSSRDARAKISGLTGSWSAAELPHRVSQKFVEEVLLRHAESSPSTQILYGWRLKAFTQKDGFVEAIIEDVNSLEVRTLVTPYLIGGDGARSTVRRLLGIRHVGETGVQRDFFGGKMLANILMQVFGGSIIAKYLFALIPDFSLLDHFGRYVDGGVRSPTSLRSLARTGVDEVFVLAPMASVVAGRLPLQPLERLERRLRALITMALLREVRALRAAGIGVTVLTPGPEDLAVMGANLMDPRRRRAVLETSLRTSAAMFAGAQQDRPQVA